MLWNWNVKVSIWRYFETEKGFLEDDSLTRENKDFWMEMNYNPSLFLLLQIMHSACLKSTWWKKNKNLSFLLSTNVSKCNCPKSCQNKSNYADSKRNIILLIQKQIMNEWSITSWVFFLWLHSWSKTPIIISHSDI